MLIFNKAYHDGATFDALQVSRNVNSILKLGISLVYNPWKNGFLLSQVGLRSIMTQLFGIHYQCKLRFVKNSGIIRTTSQISSKCLPNTSEAMTVLAVSLASILNIKNFILEGDSLVVTLALLNPNFAQDWRISPIILEMFDFISASFSLRAHKVNRNANFCTHSIVHWAIIRFSLAAFLLLHLLFLLLELLMEMILL